MLKREINTVELIALNKMFSDGRGYKDLIRDFKKSFNVDLPKNIAKQFMINRSWKEVFKWLTGQDIEPADDNIPCLKRDKFELLEKMIEVAKEDNNEQEQELNEFESVNYYIPNNVKFVNMGLYGEIITYKYKDPKMKCFIFEIQDGKNKLKKFEDVIISDDLPNFLLRIIRKYNNSKVIGDVSIDPLNNITEEEAKAEGLINIFESELFKKYGFKSKE